MKNLIFSITLAIVAGGLLAGCHNLPLAAAVRPNLTDSPDPPALPQNGDLANDSPPPIEALAPSCARPKPDEVGRCTDIERQILASTVRLEWQHRIKAEDGSGYTSLDGNAGLATIKEGRYLVTHNHAGIPLSELKNGESITVSVFTMKDDPIWVDAPLMAIAIAVEEAETLVLDFGSYSGQGLFGSMGMSSAEFKAWDSVPLQPGLEVAQIDWNGTTAQVEWVMIEGVITEHSIPRLELGNLVRPGASGGGVFWNGYHVANTWSQVTTSDEESGAVLRQYSVAALNSAQVTGQVQ